MSRTLIFALCATVANLVAITAGVFVTTALRTGLSPGLVDQSLRIGGNMLSPGWLVGVAIATGLAFAGGQVAWRAALASGLARSLLLVVATGLVALVPACLALIVFNPAIVGLAIVLAVSGAAVAVAVGPGRG